MATPYLTQIGVDALAGSLGEHVVKESRWLVCLSTHNALYGFTEPEAVRRLLGLGADVRTHEHLHAKLYLLGDGEPLILGSANLTGGGLVTNEEIVALVHDGQVSSRARELFDQWWGWGTVVTPELCLTLEREAERVAGLQASATAMMRLMGLGAFVTITTSPSSARQQHTLQWEHMGVPRPITEDIRSAPPTLLLWPKAVRDEFKRQTDACRRWVERQAVELHGREFLPRELFPELGEVTGQANRRFAACVASVTDEDWGTHHDGLEQQVRAWLTAMAQDHSRPTGWVEDRLRTIMAGIPGEIDLGGGPTIDHRLETPHPDTVPDLDALIGQITALLQRHPRQARFPGLEGTAEA